MKKYQKPTLQMEHLTSDDVMLKSAVSLTGIKYYEEDVTEQDGNEEIKTKKVYLDISKLL